MKKVERSSKNLFELKESKGKKEKCTRDGGFREWWSEVGGEIKRAKKRTEEKGMRDGWREEQRWRWEDRVEKQRVRQKKERKEIRVAEK